MRRDEKLARLRAAAPSLFMLRGSSPRRPTLSVSAEQLDDVLRRAVARERVELEMSIIAFEQTPGVSNRNFVRFAESSLPALASSGVNTPYLADHRQNDVDARLGSVTKSTGAGERGGAFQVRQTVRVTAPAAVERVARGLTTAFSIGWYPLGDVLCSACSEPVLEACVHLPGEKLEVGTVEWVTTSAELIETSEVGIPGVREGTRVEEVRALSALASDLAGAGTSVVVGSPSSSRRRWMNVLPGLGAGETPEEVAANRAANRAREAAAASARRAEEARGIAEVLADLHAPAHVDDAAAERDMWRRLGVER